MNDERARNLVAVLAAAELVADAGEDTDDGMVEVKWDEFIKLRDAVANWRGQ